MERYPREDGDRYRRACAVVSDSFAPDAAEGCFRAGKWRTRALDAEFDGVKTAGHILEVACGNKN